MLAASRLSAAGSGGGKASLHLGEKEILDKKGNCGERSEDYGNNEVPQSKASPQLIGAGPQDSFSLAAGGGEAGLSCEECQRRSSS
jgi:hypothetical protein